MSGVLVPSGGILWAQDTAALIDEFDSYDSLADRLKIVQGAAESGSPAAEFYAHALDKLLREYPGIRGATNIKTADDMVIVIARQLGEEGYTEAGANLWSAVEVFSNPLVKAEALTSLGKVQAVNYLPQAAQVLTDLNNSPRPESRADSENIAYGAIRGLEAYKEPSGYLPVFFAYLGWYSQRTKERAKEALPNIMENPSEPLISVIKSSSYNYSIKYAALQVVEESDITSQLKASAAVAALAEAWRTSTSAVSQRSILANIRKLAANMVRRYGTEDTNVYPLLERCYKEGIDTEEQIAAVAALAALASDDSARRLSAFLMDINERFARGVLTQEDERLIRVIIPALGSTGRSLARPALNAVLRLDWTSAVHRLAQDALKKIQ